MTPVKFEEPTENSEGKIVTTTADDENWYNYCERRWANARTEDGSLWVWIPRFAYRINKPASSDKEQKGTTSVVFLNGLTDKYYDDNGKEETAKRCKSTDDIVDTTGYTVHPAFTNESSIGYRNGGWVKARNYVDGIYSEATTSIKYPTFQGSSYSMNYINQNDAYLLSRRLTTKGNIYGLSTDTDSHLIKNSEWGAVAYISKSFYGIGKIDIAVNNKNVNDNTNNVYAVTGHNSENKRWNEYLAGTMSASTTGNIYGIYDMSGGTWERTAAYINNSLGKGCRDTFGASVTSEGKSTKYTTLYLSNETTSTDTSDKRSQINYNMNNKIYGDAIRETSTKDTGTTSWYSDGSYFPEGYDPFFDRGGRFDNEKSAGLFYFGRPDGNSGYGNGFRVTLI